MLQKYVETYYGNYYVSKDIYSYCNYSTVLTKHRQFPCDVVSLKLQVLTCVGHTTVTGMGYTQLIRS